MISVRPRQEMIECFHCGDPVPQQPEFSVVYDDQTRSVCCAGCQAVAELILGSQQSDYYRFRDAKAKKVDEALLADLARWDVFDVAEQEQEKSETVSTQLIVEGIHCSACAWLIENQLNAFEGVVSVHVDVSSGSTQIEWSPSTIKLSQVLKRLVEIGYHPHPFDHHSVDKLHRKERDALLKRLVVAGLGMMQVMMFVVATYFDFEQNMDPAIQRLLFLVAMVVTTPVVFYSGTPFMASAWRSLSGGKLGMDVPITLALLLAYTASCVNYFRGSGAMYFESATMFVFLMLCSRLIAMQVRHRAIHAQLALAPMLPDVVMVLRDDIAKQIERSSLCIGDRILVRQGEAIAADGEIIDGETNLDESLLTGEALPSFRASGEKVMAGSINLDQEIVVKITALEQATRLGQMNGLLERARQQRPETVALANQVAGYFIAAVISLSILVFSLWWFFDQSKAFPAMLAVLVVTCPCALSLAIPSALSAAATCMSRHGILVSRLDVLEKLPQINRVIFDKTGTLSIAETEIGQVVSNSAHPSPLNREQLLEMVAVLERHSAHPLAHAFLKYDVNQVAENVIESKGKGISGAVAGRFLKIGNADFIGIESDKDFAMYVGDDDGYLGAIAISDIWRDGATELVQAFNNTSIATTILSGDTQARVDVAAKELGIENAYGGLLPEQKLEKLQAYQAAGDQVVSLGDGVNDTGLLAGADVSITFASGADIAQASADIVLTGQSLNSVSRLRTLSQQLKVITRQNLSWAIAYNLVAIPLAAFAIIGPGLAALGMSVSSLVVIINSARLAKYDFPGPVKSKHLPRNNQPTLLASDAT